MSPRSRRAVVPSDALAWRGLATVTGMVQGPIQGDNLTKDGNGAIVTKEIGFQMNRPIDPATGQAAGQVRFQPFLRRRAALLHRAARERHHRGAGVAGRRDGSRRRAGKRQADVHQTGDDGLHQRDVGGRDPWHALVNARR